MKKLIASLIILGSIGSSYAYYASPGTVVHGPYVESIKTHGQNFDMEFKLTDGVKPPQKKTMSVNALAMTSDALGYEGQAITVRGYHNVAIYNPQKTMQRYHYTYQLTAADLAVTYGYDIDLAPNGGQFSTNAQTEGTVKNATRGTYSIKVATFITGPESVGHYGQATLSILK